MKNSVQSRYSLALFARRLSARFSNLDAKRDSRLLIIAALFLAILIRPSTDPRLIQKSNLWASWTFDPLVLLVLGLTAVWYERGWQALDSQDASVRPAGWRRWMFRAGLLALLLALLSPINVLAGTLLSANMVQHILLIMVAAFLLVLGTPPSLLRLSLPRQLQMRIGRAWGSIPGFRAFGRSGGLPLIVWLFLAAVLWGWHTPQLYISAVENEGIQALQHLSFLIAALLFWWVTLNHYAAHPGRRVTAVLYLLTTILHIGLLGALIAFSPYLWYPVYAGRTETWGLTVLADQRLAGIVLWAPAVLVFLPVTLIMFKLWIDSLRSPGSRPVGR